MPIVRYKCEKDGEYNRWVEPDTEKDYKCDYCGGELKKVEKEND